MKYSESLNYAAFDWNSFLSIISPFERQALQNANSIASHWESCAVGNVERAIARTPQGDPLDLELKGLGIHFYGAIHAMFQYAFTLDECNRDSNIYGFQVCRRAAMDALDAIQAREKVLMDELVRGIVYEIKVEMPAYSTPNEFLSLSGQSSP